MSRESVEKLIDKWVNDYAFRAELRKDPEAAVRKTGLKLDKDELAAMKNIDWNLSDDELHARVSKGM